MKKTKELSPYEKVIRNRIIKLINEYCGGSQIRFVERTGINQGSVSTYVNGQNSPSWENAAKIASAFNVDVKWVMATDVIPDGEPIPDEIMDFYRQYQALPPDLKSSIDMIIKSQQQKP